MSTWRYEYRGDLWQVAKVDLFAAEFGAVPAPEVTLPVWHAALCANPRAWAICRRLYGWQPVIPPVGSRPEELASASAEETAREFGINRAELRSELEAARGVVAAATSAALATPEPTWNSRREAEDQAGWFATAQGKLDLSVDGLFERYGMVVPRNAADRQWLAERVVEWRKLLEQAQTRPLAEAALSTMMQVRRLQRDLDDPPMAENADKAKSHYLSTLRVKTEQEEHLQELLAQVDKVAPWFGAVAGKVNIVGVMGEFVRARMEYYARGDRALADGIFTLTEIELECRTSVEKPQPQYRAGVVAFLNQAKANLWNPNWAPSTDQTRVLRRLDRAFAAAIVEANAADGVRAPELKSLDPAEEYEPLRLAVLESQSLESEA